MRPETKERYSDDWPKISKACIERAGHICRKCRRSGKTGQVILTSHHKDYDPANNDPTNLVCLCQGCHLRQQAADLRTATLYNQSMTLIRMGQLYFPGMKPRSPRNLGRVIAGKALATSPGKGRHAQRDSEPAELPAGQTDRG